MDVAFDPFICEGLGAIQPFVSLFFQTPSVPQVNPLCLLQVLPFHAESGQKGLERTGELLASEAHATNRYANMHEQVLGTDPAWRSPEGTQHTLSP